MDIFLNMCELCRVVSGNKVPWVYKGPKIFLVRQIFGEKIPSFL